MKKLLSLILSICMLFSVLPAVLAEEAAMIPVETAESVEEGPTPVSIEALPEETALDFGIDDITGSAEAFEMLSPENEQIAQLDAGEIVSILAGNMPEGALEGFVSLDGNELILGGNGRVTIPDGFVFQSVVSGVTYYQLTKPTIIVGFSTYPLQSLTHWTSIMTSSGMSTYSTSRNNVTLACGLRAGANVNYRYIYFNTSVFSICVSIGYVRENEANPYINQIADSIRLTTPLTVSTPVWTRSPDNQSIFINKPTITGGTGTYTIAYNIYDSDNQPVNYFYSDEACVAATPGYTGRFCVFVCVSDGYSSKTVNTGWFAIYTGTPLTVTGGSWSKSTDGKHAFINRPTISGGSGTYKVSYNIYDDKGNAVNYFYSDESRVAVSPGHNGNYNVYVTVNDGLSTKSIMTGWFTLTGY